jgi:protein-tyrosine phosphatase
VLTTLTLVEQFIAQDKNVLIHCYAGINRSALLVTLLLLRQGLSLLTTQVYLRVIRPSYEISFAYQDLLEEWSKKHPPVSSV